MHSDNPENLFEMPQGIRIRDEHGRVAEPDLQYSGEAELEEGEQLLEGFDPEARVHRAGERPDMPPEPGSIVVVRKPPMTHAVEIATSRGAHFIYALIALTITLGVLGLAMTWQDGRVIAACAVIAPLSITWFCLRLRAWLNRSPYVYRLLTSLGENAENLAQFRLLRWVRGAVRAFYS